HDLDLAGGELRVLGAAGADGSLDGDNVLGAEVVRDLHDVGGKVLAVEDELGDAEAVAQVDEDEAGAVPAVGVDPAVEGDGLADVGLAELAAGVGTGEHG